jgi:uncharacterized protein YdcH (DUF465 family)
MSTSETVMEPAETATMTNDELATEPTLPEEPASATGDTVASDEAHADGASADETSAESKGAPLSPEQERKRLAEQLQQLKRKEAELRRALAIADHPELTDAIRELEGKAYVVARAEEKLAQPLTGAEERKRERLEKKLAGLRSKREELDAAIAEVEGELAPLGDARLGALEAERTEALNGLFVVLARHAEGLESAGLQAASIIPELERWLPELRAMAEAKGIQA